MSTGARGRTRLIAWASIEPERAPSVTYHSTYLLVAFVLVPLPFLLLSTSAAIKQLVNCLRTVESPVVFPLLLFAFRHFFLRNLMSSIGNVTLALTVMQSDAPSFCLSSSCATFYHLGK